MIFKVDIDGVLRDILPAMCRVYNRHFGEKIKVEDIVEYDTSKIFTRCEEEGMSASDFLFQLHGHEVIGNSPAFYGAAEAMQLLKRRGHTIVIVSWQKSLANKYDTLRWLENNYIPYDSICFTGDKDIVKGDYMIDDNIAFLDTISEPTIPVCINAPYNVGVSRDYKRYNSFYEFVDDIEKDFSKPKTVYNE